MISQETKLIAGIAAVTLGIVGILAYEKSQADKRRYLDKENQRQHELELKKEESKLPPEYWNAKAEEHKASVQKLELDIQSKERLELDMRDREDAEKQAVREFEMNAPSEYWEQKRVQQEEITKRERLRLDHEAELEMSKRHSKALEASAKVAERMVGHEIGRLIV